MGKKPISCLVYSRCGILYFFFNSSNNMYNSLLRYMYKQLRLTISVKYLLYPIFYTVANQFLIFPVSISKNRRAVDFPGIQSI